MIFSSVNFYNFSPKPLIRIRICTVLNFRIHNGTNATALGKWENPDDPPMLQKKEYG
jgi:hypothetical protein